MSRLNIRTLLIGIGAFMIVFGILGSIVYPGGGALRVFDLNKEQTFPGNLLRACSCSAPARLR